MSPCLSVLPFGLLKPGGPALGEEVPLQVSFEGEGLWHQKWQGLLCTICPDMRQPEARSRQLGPSPRGLFLGLLSTPLPDPSVEAA